MGRQVKDIRQAINPSVEIVNADGNEFASLSMDYGKENGDNDRSWFKFRLILRKSQSESVKIKHGWFFKSPDDTFLSTRDKEMFDFFTHLIMASIDECNKLVSNGKIRPPKYEIARMVERTAFVNLN
jgi:hypothetical protein